MLLTLLLDPLTAIAYGEVLIFLLKVFLLGGVPLLLLLALWWHRLGKQFDREPEPLRIRPLPSEQAGSGRWYLLLLVLAMGFAVGILAVTLTA